MMNFASARVAIAALVKQNGPRLGVRGSAIASKPNPRGGARRTPIAAWRAGGKPWLWDDPHAAATAGSPLLFAFCCFPPAPPAFAWVGNKTAPKGRS